MAKHESVEPFLGSPFGEDRNKLISSMLGDEGSAAISDGEIWNALESVGTLVHPPLSNGTIRHIIGQANGIETFLSWEGVPEALEKYRLSIEKKREEQAAMQHLREIGMIS